MKKEIKKATEKIGKEGPTCIIVVLRREKKKKKNYQKLSSLQTLPKLKNERKKNKILKITYWFLFENKKRTCIGISPMKIDKLTTSTQKMVNIPNHQRNANWSHKDVSPHTHQNDCHQSIN